MTRLALLLLCCVVTGCFIPVTRTISEPVPFALGSRMRDTTFDRSVRVTRLDGQVIEFPVGSQLGNTGVWGRGRGYGVRRPIYNVPLDSIADVKLIRRELRVLPTLLATGATTVAVTVAIFAALASILN